MLIFDGAIAGLGSASGVRVVLGMWPRSPFGSIVDFMIELADGHRILVAPGPQVAEFIATTYRFDEVRIEPTSLTIDGSAWTATGSSVRVRFDVGPRTAAGWAVHLVPRTLSRRRWWVAAVDPLARVSMRGVRTVGTAGGGRREYYAAQDVHALAGMDGEVDNEPLGELRPVTPPVRFGFGSTPTRPSLVRITTLITGVQDRIGRSANSGGAVHHDTIREE